MFPKVSGLWAISRWQNGTSWDPYAIDKSWTEAGPLPADSTGSIHASWCVKDCNNHAAGTPGPPVPQLTLNPPHLSVLSLLDLGNSENQPTSQHGFKKRQFRILRLYCGCLAQHTLVLETSLGQPKNEDSKVERRWPLLALLECHQLCNNPEPQSVS